MEAINLNLIPNGTNPVVHCSQYDEGRKFRFNLFDGASVFVLDGTEGISCDIKKPDGNIVTAAVPNTEDDYIIVTTTLQMTACSGNSLGTINISKGGINLYTLNFVLYCERSPLENGIESDSAIHNLNTMVDGMVAEEVATQYDSANVIFDNVPTSGHGTPYTVTSEGIKTAIDNAFDYDNTASGSLVHIEDGADNVPVKSLVSEIVAVETGNGQPKSPTNPYTISGFANGVVSVCSVNLWDEQWELGNIDDSGQTTPTVYRIRTKNYIPCKPSTTYYFKSGLNIARLFYYDENKTFISLVINPSNSTFTTPSNCAYLKFRSADNVTSYDNSISVNYPSTDTQYHAYNGTTYTFAFGQTVYGGHFDNKGNLVVTHSIVDLGTITFGDAGNNIFGGKIIGMKQPQTTSDRNKGILCSNYPVSVVTQINQNMDDKSILRNSDNIYIRNTDYSTASDFQNSINGVMLVYELATPITLAITSQNIPTLLGENCIFSNCGDVEVTYYTSKSNDILEFIDSEIGKKNGDNIPIEENSQDSIKDYVDNGLGGKADTSDLNDKQDKNVLNIVKHYDTGTSSDAITDIITEYGKVNMVFAFDVPLGYFTGCLTFANDNMGSGFIVLSTTGRFWVVSYVSGTITLTELT